jgi:hypothetical protein
MLIEGHALTSLGLLRLAETMLDGLAQLTIAYPVTIQPRATDILA